MKCSNGNNGADMERPGKRRRDAAAAAHEEKVWKRRHSPFKRGGGRPSHLWTDENPATTIKGCGFKNAAAARTTLELTGQPSALHKQWWTVRAMRERAVRHPSQTAAMREAVAVFDAWLAGYSPPDSRVAAAGRARDRQLRRSPLNARGYRARSAAEEQSRVQSAQALQREAARVLRSAVASAQRRADLVGKLPAFVALFGGPYRHAYGHHTADLSTGKHRVVVETQAGVRWLLKGGSRGKLGAAIMAPQSVVVEYDANSQAATVVVQRKASGTLQSFWCKPDTLAPALAGLPGTAPVCLLEPVPEHPHKQDPPPVPPPLGDVDDTTSSSRTPRPSWECALCTFEHCRADQSEFLACAVCATPREMTTHA